MLRIMCKGKIHKAYITKKDLHYQGSIGIDKDLLAAADMLAGEKVQVLNINNGIRFETYCVEEKSGSGLISLYGPAARLGAIGDTVIIISYGIMDTDEAKNLKPKVVHVDKNNGIL
ncbi:MAG: aspartate 1-decarboxylase [Candidatus Omnitrophica bacterium]|nr:aspartate 1-decarboxylase [Candidatus Omnitrophota bacterium]MBU4488874.1 aspartate 1-decarboxylase [Candidatus Omnitrophota bacterium]MCG2705672.1 aspartate 1-decarboxylase [Candidatus Omnitrophota bacterium]